MPYAKHHVIRRAAFAALGLVALTLFCLLALPDAADAALQKIAGYERGDDNRFGSLYTYFANLRDAILPLSIPVATIGMVVGGTMYMFGNHNAGRLLFGVVVGVGLVRIVRRGRRRLIPVRELERWLEENSMRVLDGHARLGR